MCHRDNYPQALAEGVRIQEYQIEQVLGQGGFGITYRAMDTNLTQRVAIKEYFPASLVFRDQDGKRIKVNDRDARWLLKEGLRRFVREARVLARFKHPNIVRVFRFLEANGTAYIVMEYEQGESLLAYAERRGKLDYEETRAIFFPVLDGLRDVHAHDLLHLDIKPENIFLREDGTPVLIDFGGARIQNESRSRVTSMVRSDGYSPIEQYSTRPIQGPCSDIYATAATMYFCMFGIDPVPATMRQQAMMNDEPDPVIPAVEKGEGRFPEPFLAAVDHGLAVARSARPATVEAFQARLARTESPSSDDDENDVREPVEKDDAGSVTLRSKTSVSSETEDSKTEDSEIEENAGDVLKYGIIVLSAILLLSAFWYWGRGGYRNDGSEQTLARLDQAAWLEASRAGTAGAIRAYLTNCASTGCLYREEAELLLDSLVGESRVEQPKTDADTGGQRSGSMSGKTSSPVSIPAPTSAFGDTYTYIRADLDHPEKNLTVQLVVNRNAGGEVTVSKRNVATGYTRTIVYTNEWNVVRTRNEKGEGKDFTPPLAYYDFPLVVGKTWKRRSREHDSRRAGDRWQILEGRVEGWEKVSVPAGDFDALRVVVDSRVVDVETDEVLWRGKDVSWYAPSVKRSVKSELASTEVSSGARRRETIQLVSFNINTP